MDYGLEIRLGLGSILGLRLGLGKWLDLRSELVSVLWLGLHLHRLSNVPVSKICTYLQQPLAIVDMNRR